MKKAAGKKKHDAAAEKTSQSVSKNFRERHVKPQDLNAVLVFFNLDDLLSYARQYVDMHTEDKGEKAKSIYAAYAFQFEDEVLSLTWLEDLALNIRQAISSIETFRANKEWESACVASAGLGTLLQQLERALLNKEEAATKILRDFYVSYVKCHHKDPSIKLARKHIGENHKALYDAKNEKGKPDYWYTASFGQQWHKIKKKCREKR